MEGDLRQPAERVGDRSRRRVRSTARPWPGAISSFAARGAHEVSSAKAEPTGVRRDGSASKAGASVGVEFSVRARALELTRILRLLAEGEQARQALQTALQMSTDTLSPRLDALERHGFVECRRHNHDILYTLKDAQLSQLLASVEQSLLLDRREGHASSGNTAVAASPEDGSRADG